MYADKKILIVEDELVLQLMLTHMLEKIGFKHIDKATKGSKAISLCNKNDYDLILMDIILQDSIDGIEAYRQIKQKKDIPVIYITGNTDPKNRERAQDIGFHEYLGKPITFVQLKETIENLRAQSD